MIMNDWSRIIAYFQKKAVILLVHEKPDGDCLGSALALAIALSSEGYAPNIYLKEPMPQVYKFLPGQQFVLQYYENIIPENSNIIAVDCADDKRIYYEIPDTCQIINIDHHVSNKYYGDLNIVEDKTAAAGEIIYRIINEANIKITKEIATCLYVALATDTGSFTYSNVTEKTLKIAGELVAAGADLNEIRYNLYEKRPMHELLAMKKALEELKTTEDGRIMYCTLSNETITTEQLLFADTDSLISMMRAIDGVEGAFIFKEIEPNHIKVSMRSKNSLDVNILAKIFDGGGHARAAGCTINGGLEITVNKVIEEAKALLKR